MTMNSRAIWVIAAVVMAAIFIPVSISSYYDWESFSRGSLVTVSITRLPTNSSSYLKFSFKGQKYAKQVSGNININLTVGDNTQLKFYEGAGDHFLFPEENPMTGDLIATGILIFLAVVSTYYATRKTPPPIKLFGKTILNK
jgi:hypothetical protein